MPVVGRRWRVESEISWLRERGGGCRAISIFHADNWKPAGQLSSLCKLRVVPIYSDLESEGGGLMSRPFPTFSHLFLLPSFTIFLIFRQFRNDLELNEARIRLPITNSGIFALGSMFLTLVTLIALPDRKIREKIKIPLVEPTLSFLRRYLIMGRMVSSNTVSEGEK